MRFFKCELCGNIVTYTHEAGGKLVCCGQDMKELIPGTSDGAHEKHVPVFHQEGNTVAVKVGEAEHPMMDAHYIEFIAIETKAGVQVKYLKPGDAPEAAFELTANDQLVAVYAYCNLHGLWKAE